jgi:hypothetical protein
MTDRCWPVADGCTWTPPTLPGFQLMLAYRHRLHLYIRTFAADHAAVPDGIGWLAPICYLALVVPQPSWVLPTTV